MKPGARLLIWRPIRPVSMRKFRRRAVGAFVESLPCIYNFKQWATLGHLSGFRIGGKMLSSGPIFPSSLLFVPDYELSTARNFYYLSSNKQLYKYPVFAWPKLRCCPSLSLLLLPPSLSPPYKQEAKNVILRSTREHLAPLQPAFLNQQGTFR